MEILKELRRKHNYSQQQVADLLGISRQGYNNYELGNREPDQKTIVKLAEIFNVTTDYLLGKNSHSIDIELEGVNFALFTEANELTEENKKDVLEFIRYKKSQQRSE